MHRTLFQLGAAWLALSIGTSTVHAASELRFDAPWIGYETALYPEGLNPWSSQVADFDGDGHEDLATASWGGTAFLSVLFGNGQGGYELPARTVPIPIEALDLAAGDFDRDGDVDLAIADTGRFWEGLTVSLWLNDGDGHFTFGGFSNAGASGPNAITAADFDQDGWLDVAVAHDAYIVRGNTFAVLLNNRSGGFSVSQVTTLESGTHEVDSGDLDGDGDVDLVVAHETNKFTILLNDGGTLHDVEVVPGLSSSNSELPRAHLDDFDLDGDLDLFFANTGTGGFGSGAVGYWPGLGDASFGEPQQLDFPVYSNGGIGLTTADVSGDGWPDLLTADGWDNWFLLFGDGKGGFDAPRHFRATDGPIRIETPDLDLDGDRDVMVLGLGSLEAAVYLNPGDGTFAQPPVIALTSPALAPAFLSNIEAGDLDLDGDLDLIAGYRSDFSNDDGLSVRLNRGDGTFEDAAIYQESTYPLQLRLGDLDGDGDLDASWLDGSGRFKIRPNEGDGVLGTTQTVQTVGGSHFDLFDIDSDDDLDAVFAVGFQSVVLINNGAGGFGPEVVTSLDFFNVLGMGDFNGDGALDLLSDSAVQGYAEVSNGIGDGHFGTANTVVTGRDVHAFATGDLDLDGALDFTAIYNLDEKGLSSVRGRGQGDFFPLENFHGSYGPADHTSSLRLADVQGDGFLDALTANFAPQDFSYWQGDGDGSFAPLVRYGVGYHALDLVYGDFDGDGIGDVMVGTEAPQGSWWYPGVVLIRGLPITQELFLSQSLIEAGETASWTATGAQAGETVRFVASTGGTGDGPCPPLLGGLCLDLLESLVSLGEATADEHGKASLTAQIPDGVRVGSEVWSQAVVVRGNGGKNSVKSNVVDEEVMP